MFNPFYVWEPYLSYGRVKRLEENSIVFRQGETGHGFYYLSSGGIKKIVISEKGEQRVIHFISPGLLFGEEGSNRQPYIGTATTTAPSTLYYFSDQALLEVCQKHPEAAITFINCQVFNFRRLIHLIQLLDSPIEKQMVHYLSQYAPDTEDIPINQSSLARDLGTSRMTINKVIRKWKRRGLIKISNQKLHILDKERFYKMA